MNRDELAQWLHDNAPIGVELPPIDVLGWWLLPLIEQERRAAQVEVLRKISDECTARIQTPFGVKLATEFPLWADHNIGAAKICEYEADAIEYGYGDAIEGVTDEP